jgi:hypothetical protein
VTSATASIQLADSLACGEDLAPCDARHWRGNTCAFNVEHELNLLAHDRASNERFDVSQEPTHSATARVPLIRNLSARVRALSCANASAPTSGEEFDDFTISAGHARERLRKPATPAAIDRYSAFTVETAGSPRALNECWLSKRSPAIAGESLACPFSIAQRVSQSRIDRSAQPATSSAVWMRIQILGRSTMPFHAARLVSRGQTHSGQPTSMVRQTMPDVGVPEHLPHRETGMAGA